MKFNYFDLASTFVILLSLFLIPKHRKYWLLYAFGCLMWSILMLSKELYGGMFMNLVAIAIAVKNYFKLGK